MGLYLRDIGPARGRFFSQRMLRDRIRAQRLLGGARKGRDVYAVENMEPRLLLAADTFENIDISDYLASPVVFDGLQSQMKDLISDSFDALEVIEDSVDFATNLVLDLPGLLDREPGSEDGDTDGEHREVDLDELLDLDRQLNETSGFAEVDLADIDFGALELHDYDSDGVISMTEALRNAFEAQMLAIVDGATIGSSTIGSIVSGINGIADAVLNLDDSALFSDSADYTLSVNASGFSLVLDSGNEYDLTFDLSFSIERSDGFSFDMGRNADLLGFTYGADLEGNAGLPQVTLDTSLSFETTAHIDLTLVYTAEVPFDAGPPEVAYEPEKVDVSFSNNADIGLTDSSASIGAAASAALSSFDLRIGFLDIEAEGSFDANAAGTFELNAFTSLSDGLATTFGGVGIDFDGEMTAVLDITADFDGAPSELDDLVDTFAGISAEITLSADPFVAQFWAEDTVDLRTAPSILTDSDGGSSFAEYFAPWTNMSGDEVLTFLAQFRSFMLQFQNAPDLFGFDIPFADELSLLGSSSDALDDLLDWATPIQTMVDGLFAEVVGEPGVFAPTFGSIQELVSEASFQSQIGTFLPDLVFTGGGTMGPSLQIGLEFANTTNFNQDLDLNFNFGNLENFNVAGGGNIEVDGDLDLSFLFGIDLSGANEVAIIASELGLALMSNYSGATSAVNPVLANSARFKLSTNGFPAIEVELAAGNYTDTAGLAAALQTAIDAAIDALIDGVTVTEDDRPLLTVVGDNTSGRLTIQAASQALFTISELPGGGSNDFGPILGLPMVRRPRPMLHLRTVF